MKYVIWLHSADLSSSMVQTQPLLCAYTCKANLGWFTEFVIVIILNQYTLGRLDWLPSFPVCDRDGCLLVLLLGLLWLSWWLILSNFNGACCHCNSDWDCCNYGCTCGDVACGVFCCQGCCNFGVVIVIPVGIVVVILVTVVVAVDPASVLIRVYKTLVISNVVVFVVVCSVCGCYHFDGGCCWDVYSCDCGGCWYFFVIFFCVCFEYSARVREYIYQMVKVHLSKQLCLWTKTQQILLSRVI